MTNEYKTFIAFLDKNVKSNNELDMIIYNIGTVQRITEQFSYFFNQKIKQQQDKFDIIDLEIEFEVECNSKIHMALGLGDESTLFVECQSVETSSSNNAPVFIVDVNKKLIASLTLEGMNDI